MKNIAVIGGSSGIGLNIVQKLAEKGENVYCISKSACPVSGVNYTVVDVRDADALFTAIDKMKSVDALVYCAGVSLASSVEYAEEADLEELIDVNLTCAILSCKTALRKMPKGGRIVLLSSSGGVAPIPFDAPYSASKAGLIKFSEALDLELSGTGRKCTAVAIGGTRTRFSFKRKTYDASLQCGYYEKLKSATDALIKIEQTGYAADCVADKILKILYAKDPPPVVTVGVKNKLSLFAYRLSPRRLKNILLRHIYKI